ncbi:flavodoxin family protein [Herbiconiux sp. P18]|uniref:flavodoxin family protein n=1 Tax=Herbiconiux liangxiaofengii TaxID=3342795 RepID=UPI0035BAD384
MRAVVLYESMFGNTRQIAEAIADGLADHGEVAVININRIALGDVETAGLMVVGGPTHVHGMSRGSTRAEAVTWALDPAKHLTLEPEAPGRGIRDWLQDPATVVAPLFAAFATRGNVPVILSGNAAVQIDKALHRRATRRVVPSENFIVTNDNHLLGEEIVRARGWGCRVGKAASDLLASTAATPEARL